MLGENERLDIAADREISDDAHPTRGKQCEQLVEDHIAHRLVADRSVAILVEGEFQALQLNDVLFWHVVNRHGSKIRETRSGTETGELWSLEMDNVIPLRMGIGPSFQVVCFDLVCTVSARRALRFIHTMLSPLLPGMIGGAMRS